MHASNSVEVISGSNQGVFRNLHGKTVRAAKDTLKDVFSISYFAFATVNGKPVEINHVLSGGDLVEFFRLGLKGNGDDPYDLEFARGLVLNDPHLRQIAAEIGEMDLDERDRLIMAMAKVRQHFERVYGPLRSETRPVIDEVVRLLSSASEDIHRIANRLAPTPSDKVGTGYIAEKLGCSKQWVTEMVNLGRIPANCIVAGTGNGKPWKFHRLRIDGWIANR